MRHRETRRYCTACGASLARRELVCRHCEPRHDPDAKCDDASDLLAREARIDTNRWIDEGSSLGPERHAPAIVGASAHLEKKSACIAAPLRREGGSLDVPESAPARLRMFVGDPRSE